MPDGDLPSEVVRAGREPHSRRGPEISEILRSLTDDTSSERISVGDLLVAMGDRAFGPLMLFFALPNILPMPRGASGIFGLPLTILATQFMLGRKPWLPRIVAKRSLSRADLILILDRAEKWVTRLEKLLKPRLTILVAPPAERVIGAHCLILAIILALPVRQCSARLCHLSLLPGRSGARWRVGDRWLPCFCGHHYRRGGRPLCSAEGRGARHQRRVQLGGAYGSC